MGCKVLFGDVVPYEVPSSLSALRGPAHGLLTVPVTVHWGPRRSFDLDDVAQRRVAYRAIVREGTPQMQEALLNQAVLRREWRRLVLPERCRKTWEDTFPELAAA
ncbi:transcriptional regulator [Phytoactinopolyspora mesophila]|uniref:Transcriptional regulator n=1 Tax=Phytoactinopolyspora mesophila TaxID=2650750 RepID=A0A7K3M172_9ACTN|nr:transcriptional regulator [Phytoactinopolyspora mesophila]NDL57046.1 transcriptional regulator [Phytoactinopolyspora mesophila]